MSQQHPQLEMWIDPIVPLPEPDMAEGYRLRAYREGDVPAWCRLVTDCIGGECTEKAFRDTVAGTRAFDPGDLLLIEHAGEAVGTAWALRKSSLPPEVGYVHMVGVLAEHRGHRLGQAVMVGVLRRFHEVGCTAAQLHTDDFRLPAIKIYLDLGFRPALKHESHPERWRAVYDKLGRSQEELG
jgi:mycothiol synthase